MRRSDKHDEARFFESKEYMRHVDEFYERYLIEHPERVNSTKRLVFVASDETFMFELLTKEFPTYRFIFNSTFTMMAGSLARYSQEGFESLLFDVHFLSLADYLVCTFSSNVCRLAYELKLAASGDDTSKYYKSLDTPYFHITDAIFYKMAILSNQSYQLKRGDFMKRRLVSGLDYEEYHQNGLVEGFNQRTKLRSLFPSFMLKNHYF